MEIKLILTLLLIHYVSLFIFKPKLNILSCGIFGWSGKDPKQFNRDKFDKLGIYNVSRGKDSCGFTIDGLKYSGYGFGEKEYYDYIIKYSNKETPKKVPIVIGHTRQASPGIPVTPENIHPFAFGVNNKIKHGENKYAFQFFFAHNGTLKNHKELAKKYNVETTEEVNNVKKDKSDSNILGEIIFKTKSFKVLGEYIGTAACAFLDTKTNILYLFKGASKEYHYYGKEETERPLFYYIENDNSVYFSSLKDSLKSIGGDDNTIFELESNTVYAIKDGDIKNAEKHAVNRSSKSQKEETSYNTTRTNVQTALSLAPRSYTIGESNALYYAKRFHHNQPFGPINTIADTKTSKGGIFYKFGCFYSKTDKLYSGIALNVKNFGLVSLMEFDNLDDLIEFSITKNKKVVEICNDVIRKNYYFKIPGNSSVSIFTASEGNELAKFHEFLVKKDLKQNDVETLFSSGIIDKYFLINPGSLDVKKDYINDIEELVFIIDGFIVKNNFEFNILVNKIISKYPKSNFITSKETFTSILDTHNIAPHFKYFINDVRKPVYSSVAAKFYDDLGVLLRDNYMFTEGAPYMTYFKNGHIEDTYTTENSEQSIFLCDRYKQVNSHKLLTYNNNINHIFLSIEEDLEEFIKLKQTTDKLLTNLSNVNCVDLDLMTDRLLLQIKDIEFTKEELDKILEDNILYSLVCLTEEDISKINSYDVLDSLLNLVSSYISVLDAFIKNKLNDQFLQEYKKHLDDVECMIEKSFKRVNY